MDVVQLLGSRNQRAWVPILLRRRITRQRSGLGIGDKAGQALGAGLDGPLTVERDRSHEPGLLDRCGSASE